MRKGAMAGRASGVSLKFLEESAVNRINKAKSDLRTAGACCRNHCCPRSAGVQCRPLPGTTTEFSPRSDDVEDVAASLGGIIAKWADGCSVYHAIVLVSLDSSQYPFLRALAFAFLRIFCMCHAQMY